MEDYTKTSLREIVNKIRNGGSKELVGKNFNLVGVPRGIVSKKLYRGSLIHYTLDEHTGTLAIIKYFVKKNDVGPVSSVLQTAGEMNKKISVNGSLVLGSKDKKDSSIYFLSDGFAFGGFKVGSLEEKLD